MTRRGGVVLLVLASLAVGWWLSRPTRSPSVRHAGSAASSAAATTASRCPMPPRAARDAPPLQSPLPPSLPGFAHAGATLQPLAGFSIRARVLGSEPYRLDREARFAPLDLALGWGRMRETAVLSRLQISQGGRWYRYRWQGDPPIPRDEIVRSSANMHMIPADGRVAAALASIDRDDNVRIDGWLVEVQAADGWRWRSSLTRDDQGQGACEVVYVCSVTRE